jgi:hypothetical protein
MLEEGLIDPTAPMTQTQVHKVRDVLAMLQRSKYWPEDLKLHRHYTVVTGDSIGAPRDTSKDKVEAEIVFRASNGKNVPVLSIDDLAFHLVNGFQEN